MTVGEGSSPPSTGAGYRAPEPGEPRFVIALSLMYSFPNALAVETRDAVDHLALALVRAGLLCSGEDPRREAVIDAARALSATGIWSDSSHHALYLAVAALDSPATPEADASFDNLAPVTGRRGPRVSYLLQSETALLNAWGYHVRRMFNAMPYLVGSALERRDFRDVDVRLIVIDTEDYDRLARSVALESLNLAVSLWGQKATGLPIDFQVQSMAEAADFPSVRNPIGMADVPGPATPAEEDTP